MAWFSLAAVIVVALGVGCAPKKTSTTNAPTPPTPVSIKQTYTVPTVKAPSMPGLPPSTKKKGNTIG
jgi:hypothetical protein